MLIKSKNKEIENENNLKEKEIKQLRALPSYNKSLDLLKEIENLGAFFPNFLSLLRDLNFCCMMVNLVIVLFLFLLNCFHSLFLLFFDLMSLVYCYCC